MDKKFTLKLLSDFIAIQSVSADSKRYGEILKAVDFITRELQKMKFDVKVLKKAKAPPLIIGMFRGSKARKTIGIYAHYDIQPEDPIDEWKSPPFNLTLKNGKMYGRGVADDKGHLVQNLEAVKKLIEGGS